MLFKGSILNATYRVTIGSEVGAHACTTINKVQAACSCNAKRTTPIVADGTYTAERTIAKVAVARHGQF